MYFLYLLNVLLLGGIIWWLARQQWAKELRLWFYPALLFKLICGLLLGLLYFNYYGAGDTITYFKASQPLTAYLLENPMGFVRLFFFNEFESESFRETIKFSRFAYFSNSFFLLKLVSLLNLLTGSSYYLMSLWFSLFSFWGSARLASALSVYYPASRFAAIVAFLFFPSVVFWGSGLLKDSILMGSMCWLVAFTVELAHRKPLKISQLLLALLMLYLFIRIKLFLAAVLVPVLLVYLLLQKLSGRVRELSDLKVQALLMTTTVAMAGLVVWQLLDKLYPNYLFRQVVYSHNVLLAQSEQGPRINYKNLEATLSSIMINAPEALFSAIYRPFIGESWHPLHLLMGVENLFLLLLTLFLLSSLIIMSKGLKLNLLFVGFAIYILVAGIMIGLSTPNFGSLSRYRIAFLPFLVYLLLQSHYTQRVLHRIRSILF